MSLSFLQVHLDIPKIKDVYYLYVNYMVSAGHNYPDEVILYPCFTRLWAKDFPWLKVRQAKRIKNKCYVCYDLEVSRLPEMKFVSGCYSRNMHGHGALVSGREGEGSARLERAAAVPIRASGLSATRARILLL